MTRVYMDYSLYMYTVYYRMIIIQILKKMFMYDSDLRKF